MIHDGELTDMNNNHAKSTHKPTRRARTGTAFPRLLRGLSLSVLNMSQNAYWIFVMVIILGFLSTWLSNFRYIYGWIMDDRYYFLKGVATVQNWTNAFTPWNYQHAYFFLISYIPIKLGIQLQSYPLPEFGANTGIFRFFLLYTVFLHAGLIMLLAITLKRLSSNPMAAILGLIFFVTSPTLAFWAPEPDSRMVGMLVFLPALMLLFRKNDLATDLTFAFPLRMFLVGILLGVAQSVEYTTLYIIVPFCVVFWGGMFLKRWRTVSYWKEMAAFGLGCFLLPVVVEAVNGFVLHIPFEVGPLMTMWERWGTHRSFWPLTENLVIWKDLFLNQLGLGMIIAMLVGLVWYIRDSLKESGPTYLQRVVMSLTVGLSLVWLFLSDSQAMFRQTSVIQPFLYFFAAYGILALGNWFTRKRVILFIVVFMLVIVTGFIQWKQAVSVFSAHQGLGRALEWIDQNHGTRPIIWLPIAWFPAPEGAQSIEDLYNANPDTWLVSYFPWSFAEKNPVLLAYLENTKPVASWPSLYATDAMWAELRSRGNAEFQNDPVRRDIRVIDLGKLLSIMKGPSLEIKAVTADSIDSPTSEPAKVFDYGNSSDGKTTWISGNSPMPHYLEIQFAKAVPIGQAWVVLSPTDRIGELEIQVANAGFYHTVWTGKELGIDPVIFARWEPQAAEGLKLIVHYLFVPTGEINYATIEEIVFPGYTPIIMEVK